MSTSSRPNQSDSSYQPHLLSHGFWISLSSLVVLWIVFICLRASPSWKIEGTILYDAWAAYKNGNVPLHDYFTSQAGFITGLPFLFDGLDHWLSLRIFSCTLLLLAATYFTWSFGKVFNASEFALVLSAPFLSILSFPMLTSELTAFTMLLLACTCFLRSCSSQRRWVWAFLFAFFLNLAALCFIPLLAISLPATLLGIVLARRASENVSILTGACLPLGILLYLIVHQFGLTESFSTSAYLGIRKSFAAASTFNITSGLHVLCLLCSSYLIGIGILFAFRTLDRSRYRKFAQGNFCGIVVTLVVVTLALLLLPSLFLIGSYWNSQVPWWLEFHSVLPARGLLLVLGLSLLPLSISWLNHSSHKPNSLVLFFPLVILGGSCCFFQLQSVVPTPSFLVLMTPVCFVYFFVAAQSKSASLEVLPAYRLLVVCLLFIYLILGLALFSIPGLHTHHTKVSQSQLLGIPASQAQLAIFEKATSLYDLHDCKNGLFAALDELSILHYFFQRASPFIAPNQTFYLPASKNVIANASRACIFYRRPPSEVLPQRPISMIENIGLKRVDLASYLDVLVDPDNQSNIAFLYFERLSSPDSK